VTFAKLEKPLAEFRKVIKDLALATEGTENSEFSVFSVAKDK
jgi:hypothetical protein